MAQNLSDKIFMRNFSIQLVFLLIIVSIFLYVFKITYPFSPQNESPEISNGIVDYSLCDFGNNSKYKISGEVAFYWNKLLSPTDFLTQTPPTPNSYYNIPGIWNQYTTPLKKYPGFGYATYAWKMILPSGSTYGIKIKEIDCAYQLWIDGKNITCGKVDSIKDNYRPSWKRKEIFFTPETDTVLAIMQIANFHHRKGGLEDAMVIGSFNAIKKYIKLQWGSAIFILAVLLIMGFYHLVMFLYRPTDQSVLLFSIFNFVIAIRLATTGEKIWYDFFPDFNWITAVKLEYLSFIIAAPVFVAFIQSLFKQDFSQWVNRINIGIAAFYIILVLFFPVKTFSYIPITYQGIVILLGLYILYILIKASYKDIEHSTVLFSGYFFFLMIVINDVLYFNKWVETTFLVPFGLLLMVITQAFVISKRNAKTFVEKEQLANKLEEINATLEQKVAERTQEIALQKNEIEHQRNEIEIQAIGLSVANTQLKELGDYKENLTGMLVHDLKNPLNIVLNMAKDKMVEQAGRQMLNLVENLLDVQKYESTVMKINASFHYFHQLIEDAILQVKLLYQHKNISLNAHCQSQISFDFDRDIILRVLINLLSNAIKFTPKNGTIELHAEIKNNKVYCKVKDNGPGIKEEDKKIIFSKYGQLVSKKSGLGISTGLGLAFCKLAINAHQGEIGFTSKYGKGTEFWFCIPYNGKNDTENNNAVNSIHIAPAINAVKSILTPEDINYLTPFTTQLYQYEFYEISALKRVLKKINPKFSPGIFAWMELIETSISDFQENLYLELLEIMQQN
jgi:signal transduction histidine kinase